MTTAQDVRDAFDAYDSEMQASAAALQATVDARGATITGLEETIAELQAAAAPPIPPAPPLPPMTLLGFGGPALKGQTAKRVFLNPGDLFPTPAGNLVHLVTYKGPADHDRRAQQAAAYGKPVYLGFHHEPENDFSASEYKAEWVKFNAALAKAKATNVIRLWVMMGISFNSGGKSAAYEPASYDVVGVDAYDHLAGAKANGGYLKPGVARNPFKSIVAAARSFANSVNKPLAVCETGTAALLSGNEVTRVEWVKDMLAYLKTDPQIVAVTYFQHGLADHFAAEWALRGSSLDAYAAALGDPFFGGSA